MRVFAHRSIFPFLKTLLLLRAQSVNSRRLRENSSFELKRIHEILIRNISVSDNQT
jgi:hypothetical protein